jgi:hypothetical protein
MNLIPLVIIWIVLALGVLALFLWRKAVASHEDDNLHVLDAAAVEENAQQVAVVKKLEMIDRWGKIATVVAVLFGVVLGGLYIYQTWVQNTNNI